MNTLKQVVGHVSFVGAGTGDPELLTVKASRLLAEADAVVYDRLVSPLVMDLVNPCATLVNVGKAPGGIGWSQEAINEKLIELANTGAHVIRLKSGDPSMYGRLEEELEALEGVGVAYDVVPGITSALAASAAAKVSLTKRHRNSGVRFLTGQDINGFAEHDWKSLAEAGTVAALYMSKDAARFIQGRLLLFGADAQTPITIVENASRDSQRILTTTLDGLSSLLSASQVTGPAIVLYGLQARESARGLVKPNCVENSVLQNAIQEVQTRG